MATDPIRAPGLTITDQPWQDPPPPPTDLPDNDGMPMESPWHFGNATLLLASYVAARGGQRDDYFIGANMFLYYSMEQVRTLEYRGPDVFIVKGVDGHRPRQSWMVWDEGGRYPNVIFELLSPRTERADLTTTKRLYAEVFRTPEYFCIAPHARQLLSWRLLNDGYTPVPTDAQGRLWSEELGLWLGAWEGSVYAQHDTWVRFYTAAGALVLLPEEAAEQRADAARQRADAAEQRADTARQCADAAEQCMDAARQCMDAAEQCIAAARQCIAASEQLAAIRARVSSPDTNA